jgi:predicted lipid-binding transport protein (Tim44 family)
MRRLALLVATLAATLVEAQTALARGGSGSHGFGGGGRGFSGGGRGLGRAFGHGHFFFIPVGGGGGVIVAIIVLIIIAIVLLYVLPKVIAWWRGQQTQGAAARRKVAQRQRRVELAAAEAAEEDPAFAPEVVRQQAARLFNEIQTAWDASDRIRLRSLVAPGLLEEWERRLDDLERRGWRNRVQVLGEPKVQYVGLKNVGDEGGKRVTVRIEARLRDYVETSYGERMQRADRLSDTSTVREFWTLGKRAGHWVLISIEQGAEGTHALEEEIVATPWSNEQAMRDEALVEGAVAEAVPEGTQIAEIADLQFEGSAHAAANDLSVADGRFAPDVLEVAARRAVAAWAEAVDGSDAALRAIARPNAVSELLHPSDPSEQTRLVVRGPQVRQIRIVALDAAAQPPTMTVEVDLTGRRYIEERDTTRVLSGSQSRATNFTERWTLALDGDESQPWRIASVGSPPAWVTRA